MGQLAPGVEPEPRAQRRLRDASTKRRMDVKIRAQFGVAETGAIWLMQEDLVVDVLAFLSPHPIVLFDPEQIVSEMHEAYRRVQLNKRHLDVS